MSGRFYQALRRDVICIPVKHKLVPALITGVLEILAYSSGSHNFYVFILYYLTYFPSSGTAGYTVLLPQGNYTVFENNASAVFYCSGDGSVLVWILNGSTYGPVHQQRGITFTLSGTGAKVTSTLCIPARATNNNTKVICKVADGTFSNVQTSNSSNLTVQGEN